MKNKYEITKTTVKNGIGELTLVNCATNKEIVVPCFDIDLINRMNTMLLNRYTCLQEFKESQLTVSGKWVTRIHNNTHYKVFCLYYCDSDFGDIYYRHWSPLERMHQMIAHSLMNNW